MIVTEFYNGQGLGNQLWCYVVTRLISENKGYEFGIMSPEKFKGKDFISLNFGNEVKGGSGPEGGPPNSLPDGISKYYKERLERHPISNVDISKIDQEMVDIDDNTKIDGTMQSYNYIKDHRDKILGWLKIHDEKIIADYSDKDVCVIHIRGGDFKSSQAIMDRNYYFKSMKVFKDINPDIRFYCITDDVAYSKNILPEVEIIGSSISGKIDPYKGDHHLGGPVWIDYSILNQAKNIIMSASSFGWWPVWTNVNNPKVVAPKYWAAHRINNGYWSCGESLVDEWGYLDLNGNFFNGNECRNEIENG